MDVDGTAIGKALELGKKFEVSSQLCRSQIEVFEKESEKEGELLIACTQEAPIFLETASSLSERGANLHFTNIREKAGWCK